MAGAPDENAKFTGFENREWAIENSMMVCRRHEIELYDPVAHQINPDDRPVPVEPNLFQYGICARASVQMQMDWDHKHRNTNWRVWRAGCPTPIVDNNGKLVGYKLPDCGHRDTVVCEVDSVI